MFCPNETRARSQVIGGVPDVVYMVGAVNAEFGVCVFRVRVVGHHAVIGAHALMAPYVRVTIVNVLLAHLVRKFVGPCVDYSDEGLLACRDLGYRVLSKDPLP